MILGVLSDSHARHERTGRALRILQRLGAEAFVHCGDLQSDEVLDELAVVRARFVWGNTDNPDPRCRKYAESLGLEPPTEIPLLLELGGKRIAVFHGHEREFERLGRAVATGDADQTRRAALECDYVFYGHTHAASDARVGAVRLINPGALQRARVYTVATLDLELDEVSFWRVDDHAGENEEPQKINPRVL
ncbi:MAG: YfcE family phosphodiesterase [Planctomycetes bacterium]|nr:YfcE family phosphodiesterase [Planctomycetota bacterium]